MMTPEPSNRQARLGAAVLRRFSRRCSQHGNSPVTRLLPSWIRAPERRVRRRVTVGRHMHTAGPRGSRRQMLRAPFAFAFALALAACQRSAPTPSDEARAQAAPSTSDDAESRLRPALQGGDAASVPPLLPGFGERAYACKSDSDCVITNKVDGSCCDSLCDPRTSVSREFHDALTRAHERCDTSQCPEKSCMPPRARRVPRCVERRCAAEVQALDGAVLVPADRPPCACAPADPLCACE